MPNYDTDHYSKITWNPKTTSYAIKEEPVTDVRFRTFVVVKEVKSISGTTTKTICKIVVATKPVDATNKEFYIGWAVCSPKDKFSKKQGQLMAYGRMLKHPKVISYDKSRATLSDEIREAIATTYNIIGDNYDCHHFIGRLKNVKIGDIR